MTPARRLSGPRGHPAGGLRRRPQWPCLHGNSRSVQAALSRPIGGKSHHHRLSPRADGCCRDVPLQYHWFHWTRSPLRRVNLSL
jgi:hypothetical protein